MPAFGVRQGLTLTVTTHVQVTEFAVVSHARTGGDSRKDDGDGAEHHYGQKPVASQFYNHAHLLSVGE